MSTALNHRLPAQPPAQFLTFSLGPEEYGVPILEVQEIKDWERATHVPRSPAYVEGVLNLRGVIVPVVDLRLRFGLPAREPDRRALIVVVELGGRLAGLTVDSVTDVVDVASDDRRPVPEYEGRSDRDFISGLARRNGNLLILLDVARLLGPEIAAPLRGAP
ncbi:MAG: chemotaxis protein CheW [Acidiferrobacteraceae bacterium]